MKNREFQFPVTNSCPLKAQILGKWSVFSKSVLCIRRSYLSLLQQFVLCKIFPFVIPLAANTQGLLFCAVRSNVDLAAFQNPKRWPCWGSMPQDNSWGHISFCASLELFVCGVLWFLESTGNKTILKCDLMK